jgi:uncharacterized membrane protein
MGFFDIGDLHAAFVHFPIVLIINALVFDALFWFKEKAYLHDVGSWMIIAAAILMIPTGSTGFAAKDFYADDDPDVWRHQTMALATIAYTVGYAIFRAYHLYHHRIASFYLYLIFSLINVGLINVTAEFGGIVVRGKGVTFDTLRPDSTPLPYGKVRKPD